MAELRRELNPLLSAQQYNGFIVVEPSGRIVASFRNELVGIMLPVEQFASLPDTAFAGKSTMVLPAKSRAVLPDRHGVERSGVPTMFAAAPVFSETGRGDRGTGIANPARG